MEQPTTRKILNGWKQISDHIQRGVRTAQRWEAFLGMPVHRPALKDRTAVVAFSDELESWLCRTPPEVRNHCATGKEDEGILRVLENMDTLVRQSGRLVCQVRWLQGQLRQSRRSRHLRNASGIRMRTRTAKRRGTGSMLSFRRSRRGFPIINHAVAQPARAQKASRRA